MLTKIETAFMAILPEGRNQAMTATEIGKRMEQWVGHPVTARQVRKVASTLRMQGYVVCSTPTKPYGFYWPKSHHEATACYHELISRLTELSRTVASYKRGLDQMGVAWTR